MVQLPQTRADGFLPSRRRRRRRPPLDMREGRRRVVKQVAPKPRPWAVAVKYCGCFKNRSTLHSPLLLPSPSSFRAALLPSVARREKVRRANKHASSPFFPCAIISFLKRTCRESNDRIDSTTEIGGSDLRNDRSTKRRNESRRKPPPHVWLATAEFGKETSDPEARGAGRSVPIGRVSSNLQIRSEDRGSCDAHRLHLRDNGRFREKNRATLGDRDTLRTPIR